MSTADSRPQPRTIPAAPGAVSEAAAGLSGAVGATAKLSRAADPAAGLSGAADPAAGLSGAADPAAGLPTPRGGLSTTRRVVATVLLLAGLPLLTEALLPYRESMSYATPLLVVLVLVVAVALTGGLRVGLPGVALSWIVLDWFFTPPFNTLTIQRAEQALALVVYLAVGVAVALVADAAARRSVEATRARAEVRAVSALAAAPLGKVQTVPDLLERMRQTFGMREVRFLEQADGSWRTVASVGGGPPEADETELRVPAGAHGMLSAHGPPLFAEDHRVLAAFAEAAGTALEVRRLAEQAAASTQLEAVDRVRAALLTAVGHDLRTPLAGIKAAVTSLRQADVVFGEAERSELLATIDASADRLHTLVANLLDASRLQAGAQSVFLQPTALEDVTGRVLLALPEGDRARVQLDLPSDLPDALADPGLLERVVANLFDNALRYAPADTLVTLRARAQRAQLVVEVIDHGPGVPVTDYEKVFAPFQRLSDRAPGGVGLGLAVARGLAEAMSAELVAAQTEGGGLTMRVLLPRAPAAPQPEPG